MFLRSFLVVLLVLSGCGQSPEAFRNTDLTGASFGRQLEMRDHHGRPRQLADFHGQAVVLFFGYTACPDICPSTLAKFAEVMQALGPQAGRVQVLFVTLDPERDTAERLQEFVPWFHPSFLGLYADRPTTETVASEFRIYSAKKDVGSGLGYVLDHSAGAYLFDPAGRLRLYVGDQAPVADIVADLNVLLTTQGNAKAARNG